MVFKEVHEAVGELYVRSRLWFMDGFEIPLLWHEITIP